MRAVGPRDADEAEAGGVHASRHGRALAERNPDRFKPRYSMVTFTRMPYAEAFARGAAQDALLRKLTAGKRSLAEIDLAAADAHVRAELAPLDR